LHHKHDGPFGLYLANMEITGPLCEIWTVGLQPVLCPACWRTVLLEDESCGQPAIALTE